MTTQFDVQRAQALQTIADAQEAERRRLAAQAAPAAQIANAQAQLAEIDRAEAYAIADEMKRRVADMATWTEQTGRQLTHRLNQFQRADLPELRQIAAHFADRLQEAVRLYNEAYSAIVPVEIERSNQQNYDGPGTERFAQHQRVMTVYGKAAAYCEVALSPLTVADVLAVWINQAGSDMGERDWRIGITYALIGRLLDPAQSFAPNRRFTEKMGLNQGNWS